MSNVQEAFLTVWQVLRLDYICEETESHVDLQAEFEKCGKTIKDIDGVRYIPARVPLG